MQMMKQSSVPLSGQCIHGVKAAFFVVAYSPGKARIRVRGMHQYSESREFAYHTLFLSVCI